MTDIPQTLADQLIRGDVTLFLGAGASHGSKKADGKKIPLADELRDALCDEFLAGEEKGRDLKTVSNFVENEVGLINLNSFIAKTVSGFTPNTGLSLLPKFSWKSIYSTNYDLLVETAYGTLKSNQELKTFYKDTSTIDKELAKCINPVPLFKIHGTIDALNDSTAPLVITTSSYVDVKLHRSGIFNRLVNDTHVQTVVFIGTRLADPHIEGILSDVEKQYGRERPMHYLVSPQLTKYDESYFSSRRITCIQMGINEFMEAIDKLIDGNKRILGKASKVLTHPIQRHFANNKDVPKDLFHFVSEKIEYVHSGVTGKPVNPNLFFKGMSESWEPIQKQYDFIRDGYESLVLQVLMQSENKDPSVDIITIAGVAGSGKTTLLRRLAYDLSIEHDELVLFAAPDTVLRVNPFIELFNNTQKRTILLVDNAADQIIDLEKMCKDFTGHKIPITIIVADTLASFGDRLESLDEYIRQSRGFSSLSANEIKALLKKLRQFNALGQLKNLTEEEQFSVFSDLAQKQLLVALYEATQGRPLEELLVEEFHRVLLSEAQELYLLVATLHRFDIPVRAGLVSRVMGIQFVEFKKKFLGPLEGLVFADVDYRSKDHIYRTRHPQIAEILFRRIIDTQSKQIEQYIRILEKLNPTYSSDDQALKRMINSKSLLELTTNLEERRRVLNTAEREMPNNTFIIQQKALLEMNSNNGNLDEAERFLEQAEDMSPYDYSLKHTRATLLARKADASADPLRSKTLRAKSRELLKSLKGRHTDDSYIQLSLAKLAVKDIEHLVKQREGLSTPISQRDLLRLIEEAETAFSDVEKSVTIGPSVTTERARLRRILKDNNKSIDIIRDALAQKPNSKRLAVAFNDAVRGDDLFLGRSALVKALIAHPNDKRLNEALFRSLLEENDDFRDEMAGPLQKAFTLESDNVSMHVNALRYHFIRGEHDRYEDTLNASQKVQKRLKVSNKPLMPVPPSILNKEFWEGEIISIQTYYTFLRCSHFAQNIYCSSRFEDQDTWNSLVSGQIVRFELGFNLKGAVAFSICTKG